MTNQQQSQVSAHLASLWALWVRAKDAAQYREGEAVGRMVVAMRDDLTGIENALAVELRDATDEQIARMEASSPWTKAYL